MRGNVWGKASADSNANSGRPAVKMGMTKAIVRLGARLLACVPPALLAVTGVAAESTNPYPRMAPVDAYLMDRSEEIALARSAAPDAISKDATILVLTRTGYETAATGTNGFVCMVARGFSGAPDWPERWNPKIRAAECENPEAARSIAPATA